MTRRILLLLLAVVLVSAGCSDDDNGDDAATKSTRKANATTTTTTNKVKPKDQAAVPGDQQTAVPSTTSVRVADTFTGGDRKLYCSAWADLKAYFFYPPSTPDEVRKVYSEYGKISTRLVAAGPKEIKDELQGAQAINDEVVRTGSTNPLDRRETKRVVGVIQTYSDKQCA